MVAAGFERQQATESPKDPLVMEKDRIITSRSLHVVHNSDLLLESNGVLLLVGNFEPIFLARAIELDLAHDFELWHGEGG